MNGESRTTTQTGFITVLEGENNGKEIEIHYFPTEYTMEQGNTFSEVAVPGLESPYIQFVRGNVRTVNLELLYDTYGTGEDVRTYTDQLTRLLDLDSGLHAPPPLRFMWGTPEKDQFYCVLEKVTKKFTLFERGGIPVRARLSITLKGYKTGLSEQEKKLKSSDKTKMYRTKAGDSLWLIAYREYGNPGLWRPIAVKNGIEDPRSLEPGSDLIIPALGEG
jgi:nucleoid-associated protein YgaU